MLALAALIAAAAEQSSSIDSVPVLRYFDIRGRAEAIRLAMNDAGIPFEDASFKGDAWGKDRTDGLKASWTAAGKLAFGQVPLLEIDGLSLVQSHAILRYLGRKVGWYSGTPGDLYRIDLVADGTEDVRKRLSAIKYAEISDEEKEKRYAHYMAEPTEGARWLGFLEALVAGSSTAFAASSPEPTHADYLLLDLIDYHEACGGASAAAALLETMPALSAWRAMMLARPNLKAYLDGPARRPS